MLLPYVTRSISAALSSEATVVETKPTTLAAGSTAFYKNPETGKVEIEYIGNSKGEAVIVAEFTGIPANGSVTTEKLAAGAVAEGNLASEAVTAAKIAATAVTAAKLGSESVEEGKVKNLAISAGKLASEAVTAAKVGNLGFSSRYSAAGYSKSSSIIPGAKAQLWVPCRILQPCTLNGIVYTVGAVSSGKVAVAIYSNSGALLKKSTEAGASQATAENVQRVAFESTLAITEPQIAWLSLIVEGGAGTYFGGTTAEPSLKETQAEFKVRGSLVVPTEPLAATGLPTLSTY